MRAVRRFGIWWALAAAWLAMAASTSTALAQQDEPEGWQADPVDPKGHTGQVVSVSTAGTTMATASLDGLAKVWGLSQVGQDVLVSHRLDLVGHDGPVLAVALSSDGKLVATGGADRTVRLWDSEKGTLLATLQGHSGPVEALAFAPDGKFVASGGLDTSIRIWDVEARAFARRLEGHEQRVRGLAFSPDSKLVASASRDTTVRLWDFSGVGKPRTLGRHNAAAWCVAFSPDGKFVASGGLDKAVRVWRVEPVAPPPEVVQGQAARFQELAGRQQQKMADQIEILEQSTRANPKARALLPRTIRPPTQAPRALGGRPILLGGATQPNEVLTWQADVDVVALAFGLGGRDLAAAFSDLGASPSTPGSVVFLPLPTQGPGSPIEVKVVRTTIRGHFGPILGVAFVSDGNSVVTVGGDASVRVWGATSSNPMSASIGQAGAREVERRAMPHLDPVESLAIVPGGKRLITAAGPGGLALWDAATRTVVGRIAESSDPARAVAITPDGQTLATAGDGRVVTLRDLASGRAVGTLKGHLDAIACLAFSPDGKRLASGSKDASATLWDLEKKAEVAVLARHTSALTALAFRPDGAMLATASIDDTVKLWEVPSGRLLDTLDARKDVVDALAFSPDGSTLASGDRSGTVRLWDPAARSERRTIPASSAPIRALAFFDDGATFLEAGDDRVIRRFEVASGRVVARIVGAHAGPILAMALEPGGKALATGGADRELKSWDVDARLAPLPFAELESKVRQMAITPDGKTLATASGDQLVRTWDLATGRPKGPPIPYSGPDLRLAFSPDGRTLATHPVRVRGDSARLWDVANGVVKAQTGSNSRDGNAVAFSPDGKSWVANDDATPHLLNISTGRRVLYFSAAASPVRSLAFSPDGKSLVAGLLDGSLATWDPADHEKPPRSTRLSSQPLDVLAFSPDGRSIATGGADRIVRVLDAATGAVRLTLWGHRRPITGLAFSPDGQLVASAADGEPTLFLRDAATGAVVSNPTLADASEGEGFACLAFTPDGLLLFAGGDRGLTSFDPREGRRPPPLPVAKDASKPTLGPRKTLLGHASSVSDLAFVANGSKLVTRSDDGMVRAWDLLDANLASRTFGEQEFRAEAIALAPDGQSLAAALRLPENRLKAQGDGDAPSPARVLKATGQRMGDEVKTWDLDSGRALGKISDKATKGGVDRVASLAYSPDGKTLATASKGGVTRFWDVAGFGSGGLLAHRAMPAQTILFSPDGKTLVGSDSSGLVTLWDLASGKIRSSFTHDGGLNRAVVSPDGRLVATAGGRVPTPIKPPPANVQLEDLQVSAAPRGLLAAPSSSADPDPGGDVRLWDLATGRRVAVLPMASGRATQLAFSPDGKVLAASINGPLATLWDVESALPLATLAWPSGEARSLAFSPDGKALAIGGDDETFRVWDVPAGTLRANLVGHADAIQAAAFSPDGRTIATAGRDAAVKLWDVPPESPRP